jgi:hypothetical protein
MFRQTMTTIAALALASGIALAQQAEAPAPQKPAETTAPAPAPPRTPAQLVNVRIELTVTEQREGPAIPPRTVTMLIADRENGRVRAGAGNALLNVDARPELTRDGRIRMMLSLEYRRQTEPGDNSPTAMLTESLATILEDGKPVVVSQSADPTTARIAVRVEVKATIVK